MYQYFEKKVMTKGEDITNLYDKGYVFTRVGVGEMHKIQGIRIDINQFVLTSENRRILRKISDIEYFVKPLPYTDYTYIIQKMGTDFYKSKFGSGIFSAYKIKELFTKEDNLNFNYVFEFKKGKKSVGYAISFMNRDIIHYSYPFYDLSLNRKDIGLGMMTRVLEYAKENSKKYVYLGSINKKEALYKLQFKGAEWFDGIKWSNDLEILKLNIR